MYAESILSSPAPRPVSMGAVLCLVLGLVAGCASTESAEKGGAEGDSAQLECDSARAQKVLTYCASPRAAELGRRTAETRRQIATGSWEHPLPVGDSPTKGAENGAVTVLIFADIECPFCAKGHDVMEKLRERYPDEVRLVYKHMPLSIHDRARPASRAALAAREQDKFWEFLERAYAQQDRLTDEDFAEIASEAGLDVDKWRRDLRENKEAYDRQIDRDMELAASLGVSGTPTFAINGVVIPGLAPPAAFAQFAEMQIDIARKLMAAGVPRDELYWRMVLAQFQPPSEQQRAAAAEEPVEQEEAEQAPPVVYMPTGDAPSRGASADEALVTIVEFSDFQCPFCNRAQVQLDEIMSTYGGEVRLVFRHFPLSNHPRAEAAARAAVVAAEHGDFWKMHDMLFEHQDRLGEEALVDYARKAGVDDKIDVAEEMSDEGVVAKVRRDFELGAEHGVRGTPTFFVNGRRITGARSKEEWKTIVDEQIAVAKKIREEKKKRGEELYRAVVEANRAE
jgi:protein-disulfide isomerase